MSLFIFNWMSDIVIWKYFCISISILVGTLTFLAKRLYKLTILEMPMKGGILRRAIKISYFSAFWRLWVCLHTCLLGAQVITVISFYVLIKWNFIKATLSVQLQIIIYPSFCLCWSNIWKYNWIACSTKPSVLSLTRYYLGVYIWPRGVD